MLDGFIVIHQHFNSITVTLQYCVMPATDFISGIPLASVVSKSPIRPTPKFFSDEKTFSTKKERDSVSRTSTYPRPPIKSCPPKSRVFKLIQEDKPRLVSFRTSSDSLSPAYDGNKKESYFHQCFIQDKKLGEGSFGEVFSATSKDDGKVYAIKRSRDRFKGDMDRKRKLEEVSKHELLPAHENCVKFYKAWEEKQHLYIQIELCETSLANLSEKEHDIPEYLIWNYLIDLLRAVKHLHDYDLIHMDIKPENIFIAKDGTCKLGDFGLILDLSKQSDLSEAQEGDPKYLAPELMEGVFTKAADVFSLGITILELACDLDLPRGGQGWHQLRSGSLPGDILNGKISKDLLSVISIMMEPDHRKRPSVESLLNHPLVKQRCLYRNIKKVINKQINTFTDTLRWLWCSFVLFVSCILSKVSTKELESDKTAPEPTRFESPSVDGYFTDDEGFVGHCSSSSCTSAFDSSTDSNYGSDHIYPLWSGPKAFSTGAKRRTARLVGISDSPVKTPSPGSPILAMSSRSPNGSINKGPSSTTPPSCRKLFGTEEDDHVVSHIGPKNLLSAFDNADSEDDL